MKQQKGFIQIPILAAIIMGILAIGGAGYFGINQYQKYQTEKIDKEKEALALAEAQQKALKQTQVELEKLRQENEYSREKQEQLEQKIKNDQQKMAVQNIAISAGELNGYMTGVGEIDCGDKKGSASLWNLGGILGFVALTNEHVISGDKNCNITVEGNASSIELKHYGGLYELDKSQIFVWNSYTDISVLKIMAPNNSFSIPASDLNYDISSLKQCSTRMQIGLPVVIIGYPAFSQRQDYIKNEDFEGILNSSHRTVSNGIISAHDSSAEKPVGHLPYPNYYISAKIDSGNSGGIALSKDNNGLCVLGVPTWLSVGNFETQGIVQNIHNVMYKK